VGRGRGGRCRRAAQATLEFAVVAPIFLVCLLGALDAGLWALENSAEVAAVEQAARAAAAAPASPLAQHAPDAATLTALVAARLQQLLFGSRLVAWCEPDPHSGCGARPCPARPADVQAAFGPRVVAVCVEEDDPPPCVTPPPGTTGPYPPYCGESPTVTVRLIGYVASLVPPGFGFAAQAGEIPTDIAATTHILRFAP